MHVSPSLTAEEFEGIHNAVVELDDTIKQLEEVINNEIHLKLCKVRDQIRKCLGNSYQQEAQAFSRKSNHYQQVAKELGLTFSNWSIYNVEDMNARHPFSGADRLVYKDHWGKKPVQSSINGLTWAALFIAADACIRDSGDNHHVYIEEFCVSKEDPRALFLSTGS